MPRLRWALPLAVLLATAIPSASAADVTATPSSGPPGTSVAVSGVTTCDTGGAPPTLGFAGLDHAGYGSVTFTPPSGIIVVPDVPFGTYRITLSCGAAEGFVVFVVNANPSFAG